MGCAEDGTSAGRRYFIGIGVGSYDDPELDIPRAEPDVVEVAEWFTRRSGVAHARALENLGKSPCAAEVTQSLRDFLDGLDASDVVVIYIACHGELDGARAHLFGRDTPRTKLAGRSIDASTFGTILGQGKPHNILLIIDACVAGRLGSVIQRAAEDASDADNSRDPHRPFAQVLVSSTFGRDLAYDGRFAKAFLRAVSDERWTGTTSRWIDIDHLIRGLNEELRDIRSAQIAERRVWGPGAAELIPNPNLASCRLGQLIADEEFHAHFDPSARGVARGEAGTFFTGRERELQRIVRWLGEAAHSGGEAAAAALAADFPLLVITGSPGCGKSALLSRIAVLADSAHRPGDDALDALADGTVPPAGALDAVVWCHNKTERQIIEEIAAALGGSASTPDALLRLAAQRRATIAIDALDETQEGLARQVASRVLRPLAEQAHVRLLVATRRRPVRDGAGGDADLLDHLGAGAGSVIDLDQSPETRQDLRDYVAARIRAIAAPVGAGRGAAEAGTSDQSVAGITPSADIAALAEQIAEAAGRSFLVAAIAARSAAAGKLARRDGRYVLPTEVGEALAGYIHALPDPIKARGLLRPLAWSQGAGLPWGTLWPRLATALARVADTPDTSFDDHDVRTLLDQSGDLVVESVESGQPVYRLFHEALAEHLRADTNARRSHDALAGAMLALCEGRPWHQVPRYITVNLPRHLLGAGRMDALVALLTDPTWDRFLRQESADPLAAVAVADAAIERLLADSPTDLRAVALCIVHSRAMTTAAPLILDVIARSGQRARAEMMANNLAYAPDRMLAYRLLCAGYARERDAAAARRCFEEVDRSAVAMPPTHRPMAWCWVAEAARDAGLDERARDATRAAVSEALSIEGDGWGLPNGCFWAARACDLAGWEPGAEQVRKALDALDDGMVRRNQALQAASAARHRAFLEQRHVEYLGGARYPGGMIRDGNIALALADAGMHDEAKLVLDALGRGAPEGEADSCKRWAWALALVGRMDRAIEAIASMDGPIEKSKAIARVATVAVAAANKPGDEKTEEAKVALGALVALVRPLLGGFEPRSQARLIHVLWMAGERAEALALAEQAIAAGHTTSVMADPRDGIGQNEATAPAATEMQALKTDRRETVSSIVLVADEQWSREAESAASRGELELARTQLDKIAVPLFRARALAAIARREPDAERALASWLRAMANARRAGRGAVDELWPCGIELLHRAGRSEEAKALNAEVEQIDIRWELESFSEQYEALRRTMPTGAERTRRMTALLLVAHRLAQTHSWSPADIHTAWASNEDGKRLFALGLMQGDPQLANVEVLVDGIRASRSAFEQYHALRAAEVAVLRGEDAKAVRSAVQAELRGELRADGIDTRIGTDSDRFRTAQRVLRALED